MTNTHAAAYTSSGRDTGHAWCGNPDGPVSLDWDHVDCTDCGRLNEEEDAFNAWHTPHRARITASQADTRQHLQAALGQIIAARAELSILHDDRCEFDCVCLPTSVHADIEAFIADAERMLRAAQALTRSES